MFFQMNFKETPHSEDVDACKYYIKMKKYIFNSRGFYALTFYPDLQTVALFNQGWLKH